MSQVSDTATVTEYVWLWPFVRTLIATFVGATLAFILQNYRSRRQERTEETRTFNRTAVSLGQMQNELLNYKDQAITPFMETNIPYVEMRPSLLGDLTHIRLHADQLAFLCETDDRQIPFQVGYTDSLFIRAIGAIDERATYHLSEFQPEMPKHFKVTDKPTIDEIEAALGPVVMATLKSHTEAMVIYVDSALKEIKTTLQLLRVSGKERYGKGKTVTVERRTKPPAAPA